MAELPQFLRPDNSDPLTFDGSQTTFTIEQHGTDRNGYVQGNMPSGSVLSAGHGHIYIAGEVEKDAKIRGRSCMYCAKSLNASVEVKGGLLMIVGDGADRNALLKMTARDSAPPTLVVPEAIRTQVFDLIGPDIRSDEPDIPKRALRAVQKAFPAEAPSMELYYARAKIDLPPVRGAGSGRSKTS